MDDLTRENSPNGMTQPAQPDHLPDVPDQASTQQGANRAEFTQFARPMRQNPDYGNDRAARTPPPSPTMRYQPPASVPSPEPYQPYQAPVPPFSPAPQRPARRQQSNWLLVGGVVFLFGMAFAFSMGALVLRQLADSRAARTPIDPPTEAAQVIETPGTPAPTPTVGLSIQPWDGNHRLTILLMGLDKRPGEKGTAFRTDSMMLLSIDPTTRQVGLLSIPRDLFVDIPKGTAVGTSYGLQRVNSAYTIGELAKPGYGPQLAMQTVQYNLGMRVNDYVVFEFNTVINAVDDIGGIDIDVPTAINDPAYPNMYYGYDPLHIPAGHIHMNGDMALKYGRTRHQTSDFDRVKRQQQVIMAMRDKILNLNMLPTLLVRAPDLWNQISQTTQTDLQLGQVLQLAVYLKDIPKENIHQGVIDVKYVTPVNYQGAAVLVPERATIGPLLAQVFGPNYNS